MTKQFTIASVEPTNTSTTLFQNVLLVLLAARLALITPHARAVVKAITYLGAHVWLVCQYARHAQQEQPAHLASTIYRYPAVPAFVLHLNYWILSLLLASYAQLLTPIVFPVPTIPPMILSILIH